MIATDQTADSVVRRWRQIKSSRQRGAGPPPRVLSRRLVMMQRVGPGGGTVAGSRVADRFAAVGISVRRKSGPSSLNSLRWLRLGFSCEVSIAEISASALTAARLKGWLADARQRLRTQLAGGVVGFALDP
ncbi:hypothetical protein MPLA_760033 [Mesorhizobium sp. ORS 3359]|nr:hypothetical protein MPLA_760033 [Mesorhizobium sp. ORS 3359]